VRWCRAALIALAAVAVSAGCKDGEPKPKKTKAVASKTAAGADTEEKAEAAPEFRYDPEGKPDPFKSYVRQLTAIQEADLSSPLQRFDLSQLAVTGIVWAAERPRALIEDPTGKGYVVQTGAAIGKNRGRIVHIGDNRVTVKETYVDSADQATTTEVDMYLYEKNGG